MFFTNMQVTVIHSSNGVVIKKDLYDYLARDECLPTAKKDGIMEPPSRYAHVLRNFIAAYVLIWNMHRISIVDISIAIVYNCICIIGHLKHDI